MGCYVEIIIIILFLLICSYYDIKEKIIYTNICIVFAFFVLVLEIVIINTEINVLLGGGITAALVFIISGISNDSIGKGDALIFLVIGIMLGGIETFMVFVVALVITVMYSIPLMILKKKKMKSSIPFSPFILISFFICLFLNGGKL